jgi:hypothetical protein
MELKTLKTKHGQQIVLNLDGSLMVYSLKELMETTLTMLIFPTMGLSLRPEMIMVSSASGIIQLARVTGLFYSEVIQSKLLESLSQRTLYISSQLAVTTRL